MKFLLITLLTMSSGFLPLHSTDGQTGHVPQTITFAVVVNKPAMETWKVFSEIDGLEKVIPSLLSETRIEGNGKAAEGCVRFCKSPQGGVTREKVVKLDHKTMFYAYEFVEGMPAKMINSFRVVPIGENMCKVVWTSDYTFINNPHMKEDQLFLLVNMAGQKIVDEVKAYFNA